MSRHETLTLIERNASRAGRRELIARLRAWLAESPLQLSDFIDREEGRIENETKEDAE